MTRVPPKSSLEFQAPHATQRTEGTIRVRAKRRGYYDHHIKEQGDEFTICTMKELGSWMEYLGGDPETDEKLEEEKAKAESGESETAASGGPTAPATEGAKADKPKGGKKSDRKSGKPDNEQVVAKPENDVL